jgi:hypothetical protein
MIEDLLTRIQRRYPLSKANLTIRFTDASEEVDLILVDPQSKCVVIGELRWMLQPGDAREVYNRKKACLEKVPQLRRKVSAVRNHLSRVLSTHFELDGSVLSWHVHGVVVIQTFGGTLSPDAALPIMTSDTFITGVRQCASLAEFATWSQSLTWLPKEGTHFRVRSIEFTKPVLGKKLYTKYLEQVATPMEYFEFVSSSTNPSGA